MNADPVAFSDTERRERLDHANDQAAALGQSLDDPELQALASRTAIEAGFAVGSDNPIFSALVDGVQRALIEHSNRDADRAALNREKRYDPLFSNVSRSSSPPTVLTLERAVELFKSSPERLNVAPKTRAAWEFRYATLLSLLDPKKPVLDVTRSDLLSVRDALLKLPTNAQKRFPNLSLQRVAILAAERGLPAMSAKSAKLYMDAASALFRWLVNEELATKNPAAGVRGAPTPTKSGRRGFSVDELNALFAYREFSGAKSSTRGWLYWLPRLALFTGARFSELLALRAGDVSVVDNIVVLSVAPNTDRNLKTSGSARLVPLHHQLIELGILDQARGLPSQGLLFPDALGPKDMLNARNKEMGRKTRAAFSDKSLVFHSFRHTFRDAARRARISRDHVAMLGGWEIDGKRSAMDDYGRDPLIELLNDDVQKVTFDGLRL